MHYLYNRYDYDHITHRTQYEAGFHYVKFNHLYEEDFVLQICYTSTN